MSAARPSLAVSRMLAGSSRPGGSVPPPGTVSLAMGEPDFATPEPIVTAAGRALREGWTRYGDLNGDPELRELIAGTAARTAGAPVSPDQVLVTHGGSSGLAAVFMATVDPGDRVVMPDPTYSLYADQVHLAGGTVVRVPTLPDGHLDTERLAAALPGARMLVFCNPVNPTGAVFGPAELEAAAGAAARAGVLVMADEAYAQFVYDGRPFTSALAVPGLAPRLVLSQTLSKTYAMTGWRIGYVIAPPELSPAVRAVHRTVNASINAAVQRAAIEALTRGPALAAPMLAAYQERRDAVTRWLAAIPGLRCAEPEGAFYAFPRYEADVPSVRLAELLLAGGVAVRPGREFGPAGEGHVRISFAADLATLEEGLARVAKVLAGLR
jgi:aspartate aminotransferase